MTCSIRCLTSLGFRTSPGKSGASVTTRTLRQPSAAGDFLLDGVELTCESDVRVGHKVVALRHGQKRDQISLYSFQDRAVSVATISLVVPGGASITFVDSVDPPETDAVRLLVGDGTRVRYCYGAKGWTQSPRQVSAVFLPCKDNVPLEHFRKLKGPH